MADRMRVTSVIGGTGAGRGGTVWWSILDGAACRQHALDNNGSDNVEALAPLTGGEADPAQDAGWAGSLDEDTAVNLVGGAAGQEQETTGRAGRDPSRGSPRKEHQAGRRSKRCPRRTLPRAN